MLEWLFLMLSLLSKTTSFKYSALRSIFLRNKTLSCSYHVPVMKNECLENLKVSSEHLFIDCTLGGGGHTRAILERGGCVVGLDQDVDAIKHCGDSLSTFINEGRCELLHSNFRNIAKTLKENSKLWKNKSVGGILVDLGVSSHQIDFGPRGFSFDNDGPLDMRMDFSTGLTAEHIVNSYDVDMLADVLFKFGDEARSRQIAREIVASRPMHTTAQLVNAIARITSFKHRAKTFSKCFQALRIAVNDELGALKELLSTVHTIMPPGSRLAVLSYHSLEDRLVKNMFRSGKAEEGSVEIMQQHHDAYLLRKPKSDVSNPWRVVTKKALVPSEEEIANNRRSRSAKLRVAARI